MRTLRVSNGCSDVSAYILLMDVSVGHGFE